MKNHKKCVLVTGCAGFIGSSFCERFLKEFPKTEVVGIDNFATGRKDRVIKGIIFCEGSITDDLFLEKIFKEYKPEYVFHFAALPRVSFSVENPAESTLTNVYGTALLLEKSRDYKVKRFIYSSSSSIYGGAKKLPTKESENPPDPKSPYALQKYAGEPFIQIASKLYGIDTVALRYFNVYGPWQYGDSPYSTVVSAWLEGLYFPRNKKLFIEGNGTQSRDFSYIDDVVQANILAMKAKGNLDGMAMNISSGERVTLRQIKTLIEKLTGKRLALEKRSPRLGDVLHTMADTKLARRQIGFRPRIGFEEGILNTIAWYEKRVRGLS